MKISPARRLARLRRRIIAAFSGRSGKKESGPVLPGEEDPAGIIRHWESVIASQPKELLAPAYLALGRAFREEGLLDRAVQALRKGTRGFPNHPGLREALADLSLVFVKQSNTPRPPLPPAVCTAHLFTDRFQPHGKGTVAFASSGALKRHVAAMLDFAEKTPVSAEPDDLERIDAFAIWGVPCERHTTVRNLAALEGKPLLCMDSGFLGFPGIESKDAPVHSIIVSPDHPYCDATRPSVLTDTLNSDEYALTPDQLRRAEQAISSIVSNRVSKSNHAPRIDLRPRFPADGTRRILLVDQRKGGSIHWSLGGTATFQRMWEAALATPDCQILVKLHPEAIAGRARSMLAPFMRNRLPENVVVIDFDVNPFDLFAVVGEVFVASSQLGFEALMAGKEVHCFAAPFYAGWGLTFDRAAVPRRKWMRSLEEVFHLYYIVHSRYFVPDRGVAEIEDLIEYLAAIKVNGPSSASPTTLAAAAAFPIPVPLKILIVIPNERFGPTGRYSQDIGLALTRLGCEVMVLAEGPCPPLDVGVRWRTLVFEGIRMSADLRAEIAAFSPHFVYENGVRSRSQRAALEAVAITGARFALHSADDDVQVHQNRKGEAAAEKLVALDRPGLTTAEIEQFLRELDWKHSLHVLLDPEFDRWIEPILRILCYRMASLHTAIWCPFEERLAREYEMPTLIVPPVASSVDFARIPLTPAERQRVLKRYGIGHERTVIFINGSLYSYSAEYSLFLDALNLTIENQGGTFALVIVSGRSALPIARMARERLDERIEFADLGVAEDQIYMEMLKACDVVCSPGLPDTFNRYRLPSRLVKAMAMGKPILTCRCGFGESLEHGGNAFLMDGEDPASWAAAISLTRESSRRSQVGTRGREFASEHFDATRVATALKRRLEKSLAEPPRTLAAGIRISITDEIRPRPKIRLRGRHHSPRQPAIHALALRTHRLDTVVHIGSGACDELNDYCRLGARRIALPEGTPSEAIGNFAGTISTIDLETAVPSGCGTSCHLLFIEDDASRAGIFRSTPVEVLTRFRWIATLGNDAAVSTLEAAGFREIRLPPDHCGQARHLLFERIPTAFNPAR